jgi:hypothetical protein
MTREQILQIVRATPNIGKVTHEEFADYVLALAQRKKTDEGWQSIEHPYMTVDGKLAMANQDHARQGRRLDFGTPQILVDTDEQLTLLVTVTSELYGTRHGIATSRKIGGTTAEREFPWEVAETSAIGRALSTMGYGVFPVPDSLLPMTCSVPPPFPSLPAAIRPNPNAALLPPPGRARSTSHVPPSRVPIRPFHPSSATNSPSSGASSTRATGKMSSRAWTSSFSNNSSTASPKPPTKKARA